MMRTLPRRTGAAVLMTLLALVMTTAIPVAAQPSEQVPEEAIRDAIDHARSMPDAFGGVWLTHGGVVFAFTFRATDAQITEVLDLVEPGTRMATVRVDSSEAELDAAHEAIMDAVIAGELTFVTGVGTSIQENALVISIVPDLYEVCQGGLLARFGSVRLLFELSAGDAGRQGTTEPMSLVPSGSPLVLPPGCLPPPGASPDPASLPDASPALPDPQVTGSPSPLPAS